jgi:hypothetical protein
MSKLPFCQKPNLRRRNTALIFRKRAFRSALRQHPEPVPARKLPIVLSLSSLFYRLTISFSKN